MGLKICALTMVDHHDWALSRWYAHHGAELGAQNLYILHADDLPKVAGTCPGAQVIPVERDILAVNDRTRARILDRFHAELARHYDWVIRTEVQEILFHDPQEHHSLAAVFEQEQAPVLTALGLDIVEVERNKPMMRGPVLGQRRNLVFSGHVSKAVAARRPQKFRRHGIEVAAEKLGSFPFRMPQGLYLADLTHANRTGEASEEEATYLEAFGALPKRPWDKAVAKAYSRLSEEPARIERHSLVRAQVFKPTHRTKLPGRFGELG